MRRSVSEGALNLPLARLHRVVCQPCHVGRRPASDISPLALACSFDCCLGACLSFCRNDAAHGSAPAKAGERSALLLVMAGFEHFSVDFRRHPCSFPRLPLSFCVFGRCFSCLDRSMDGWVRWVGLVRCTAAGRGRVRARGGLEGSRPQHQEWGYHGAVSVCLFVFAAYFVRWCLRIRCKPCFFRSLCVSRTVPLMLYWFASYLLVLGNRHVHHIRAWFSLACRCHWLCHVCGAYRRAFLAVPRRLS